MPTLSMWERSAFVLLFVALVLVTGVVIFTVGSGKDVVVGPPENRPVVPSDISRPVPVIDAYDIALTWAREWDEHAWLILVSAQFEFAENGDTASGEASLGSILFTFAGPKSGDEWPRLVLAVSRQTGGIFFEDELSTAVRPPESIHYLLQGLPITAEQAFRTAYEVTGRSYQAGCEPSRNQVQVALDTTQPDAAEWVVVFFDQRERNVNDVVMRIDARSGTTTTEIRDDPSCSTSG